MFLRQLSILLQQHFAIRTAEPLKLFLELLIPSLFTVFFAVGVWISHPIHRDAQQFAGKVTDASIIIEMTGAFCQNASKLPPTAPTMIAAADAVTTTATSTRRPGAMKLSFGAESSMVGPCMKPPQGCLNAPFEDVCMPSFEMTFKMFQMATFSGVASAPRLPMSLDVHAMMASFSNDKLNGGSFFSLIDPINSVGRIVTVGPHPHVAAFRSFCIDLSEACARLLWPDTKLSEDAAVSLSKARDDIWVVIVFAGSFDPMGRAEYTIRMTPSRLPPTTSVETPLGRNASDANSVVLYSASGFLLFQRIVNDFILTQAGAVSHGGMAGFGAVGPSSTWTFGNMPLPKHVHSDYLHFCFKFLPIIMTFCFMYPMARLAAALTEEREYGRLPLMTAFGVKPLPHRAAWAIVATVINVIAAIFATAVGAPTVFHSAPWTLLLVVHLFYAMNLSSVAVAVSSCCRRSHVAAVAAPFVIFASTIPHFTMPANLPVWVSWVLSVFLPANAYPSALSHLGEFSAAGVEYTWADAFSATKSLQRFPVAASLLTLVLNSILCLAAGWLFAAVRDGELQWRLHSLLFSKAAESCPVPEEHGGGAGVNSCGSALQTTQGEVAVELRNVSKRFGDVDAVRDISFGLKTANVTTMLGRNGAGKSTTMSLLCGTSSPTDGHVVRSSASGDAGATRHVGLCPQDNVLWPMLSVEANIRYAALLSADTDSVSGAAASIAETTALLEIDQAMLAANAEELSQGQQRRVCIAMALVGGCDLIVLDEPTAGIDAQARRAIWAAIRQARAAGRAVLVSTHDMIEADALSDTLLILEHGRIKVHGAYDDLKRKASSNDTGCPVISPHTTGNTGAGASTLRCTVASEAAEAVVVEIVMRRCPEAKRIAAAIATATETSTVFGAETNLIHIAFGLPRDASQYSDLIAELESKANDKAHPIKNVSVAAPGAVDIYAAAEVDGVADSAEKRMDAAAFKQAIAATASSSGTGAHSHGAPPSLWCQFKALCIKRLHGMKRDRQLHVFQILIPVVFLSMAFLIGLAKAPHQPSIPLTSEMFLEGRRGSEVLFAADSPMDVEIKSYLPAELAPVVTNTSRVGIKSQSTLQALLAEEYYTHGAGNGAFRRIAVASVTVPHYEQGIVQTVLSLNASAPHAAPMAQQMMHNAVLARHFANTTKFPLGLSGVVPQIVGHNHPLPTTEKSADQLISVNKIMNTLSIIIPYALLPAQYAIVCVRDREFKIAHREWVAGAGTLAYWLSAFVIDTLSFLFTATLTLILLTVFHVDKIKQHGFAVVGAPVSLIVLYGLAMVPASYTLSQLFTRHTVAQNAIMIGVFIVAYALVMGIQIVALMKETMDTAENIAKVLRVLPPYAFGEGMWAMTQAAMASLFTPAAVGGAPPVDYFGDVHFASNPDITGASFAGGAGTGLKYLAPSVVVQLLVFIATQVPIVRRGARTVGRAVTRVYNKALSVVTCGRCSRSRGADAFTATTSQEEGLEAPLIAGTDKRNDGSYSPAEEVYGAGVNRGSLADEPIVCLDGITASYGVDAPAVRSVSLNAKFGRVLALMGLNGAGKSTLFSVLTGALPVDDGVVSINGEAISDSVVRADVGYCPQRDGLPQDLTPVEIMTLYCRLKGVDPASIDGLLDATGIAPWASSTIRTLSGGTRRRVSLALALIGDPAVLLLDEPTAGLDPTARRQLWETVRSASAGRCTVLTTHHAEEIDALALDGVVLDHGRVCMAGTIADLRQRSPVAHVINATFETAAAAQNWKSRAVSESWASGVTIDCDASKCAVSVGHGTAVSVILSSVNGAGSVRSVSVSKPSIDVVIPLRNAGAEATQ